MATLLRWYNPMAARLALLAISVSIALATGQGIVFAEDGGGP
jgi:hypothetical protein